MTAASSRLNASIGDLEASVSDGVAAIKAAAGSQGGVDEATINGFADRVDSATKLLTDALAPADGTSA